MNSHARSLLGGLLLTGLLSSSAYAQLTLYWFDILEPPNPNCSDTITIVRGPPMFVGNWEQFGTNIITVSYPPPFNGGFSFRRINEGIQYLTGEGAISAETKYQNGPDLQGPWNADKTGVVSVENFGAVGSLFTMGTFSGVDQVRVTSGNDCGGNYLGSVYYQYVLTAGPVAPDTIVSDCKGAVADPINVLNGNVSVREADIEIPTPGVPLLWERAYNSVLDLTTAHGPQWTHSYDWRITRTNGVGGSTTNLVALVQVPNGSQFRFVQSTSGVWQAVVDCTGVLTENAGAFTYRTTEQLIHGFDTNGVLQSISDDWGNTLALAYTNSFPTQRLVGVSHSCGLFLTVEYTNGLISRVATPATNLSVAFAYNARGELTNATVDTGAQLQSTVYQYFDGTNATAHSLTQRVNAAGFATSWAYSTNAAGQLTGKGIRSYTGSAFHQDVSLESYGTNATETVVRIPRDGVTNVYHYKYTPALMRLYQIAGPNDYGPTQHNVGTRFVDNERLKTASVTVTETGSAGRAEATLRVQYESSGQYPTNVVADYFTTATNTPDVMWAYEWDTNLMLVTKARDPEGVAVELTYTNRSVSAVRQSLGSTNFATTRYSYTTNGWLTGATNANGAGAALTYDAQGFVNGVTPSLGPAVIISNDALGRPIYIERPGGRVVTLERDGAGLVRHASYSDAQSETFQYDGKGLLTNHVDIAGRTNIFSYEFGGRLASITRLLPSGSSAAVNVSFDQQLNMRSVSDELGRSVESYGRDGYDRVVTVTNLESQTMTIDYAILDLVRKVTRFDGTIVSNSFDTKGNLTGVSYPGATSQFDWYKNAFLRSAANEAGTISNAMDAAGRLESSRSAAPSGLVSYAYFPAGNVSSVVSVAGTTKYAKDAADRVTGIDGPTADASITYNADNGLIDTLAYSNGVTATYSWDVLDRLTGIRWVKGTNELRRLGYSYNAANLIGEIAREAGRSITYSYDDLDRLTFERLSLPNGGTGYESEYGYDLAGNRTSKRRDGVNVSYTIGSGNKLTGWSVTGAVGSLTVPVTGHSSETIGTNELFGYLSVSGSATTRPAVAGTNFWVEHLPVAAGTQQVVAAIRDAAGNMGYDTNTLTVLMTTNAAYGYNAAGCVTSITYQSTGGGQIAWALEWNGRYELTGVRSNGTVVETYTYDALGRRALVASGGTTNYFVYDGPHIVADVNATGGLVRSYLYGPGIDNILAMTVHGATNQTYYYLKDHLGSVLALTDQSGNLVESYEYDTWGRPSVFDATGRPTAASATGNRFLFQGREYAWSTGLYYFRARWLDSVIGRWLSQDPLGSQGGLNQYLAFADNPANLIDPSGLLYCDINVTLGAGPGVTFGVMLDSSGISPYAGWGIAWPGASLTFGRGQTTHGWQTAFQYAVPVIPIAHQIGYAWQPETWFHEGGIGTPGVSFTSFYVFDPWIWPGNRPRPGRSPPPSPAINPPAPHSSAPPPFASFATGTLEWSLAK